ncbi:MAG: DUF1801 domain-containing protein [Acidobacteriota bacterium]|nr:DUF1801 domain-containing protein [Acidobacteriota bacterium]
MPTKPGTVSEYLASLPDDTRADIAKVRSVIRKNLPKGYKEMYDFGMITYAIPLSAYPETYNKKPLCYAALAGRKGKGTVYLMNVYGEPGAESWFQQRYRASGKKLDMGKSCVHFKTADDLPLDLIGETIARTSVEDYIRTYEASRSKTKAARGKTAKAGAVKKAGKKAGKKK